MSEAELIMRILSGEESLFARIVDRYGGYVWALCSSYVRNPSDCEDLTQEVFVQCYRRLDTLRNPAAFGQWLSQLARRCCLMWLRTSARRERHLAEYEEGAEALQTRTGDVAMESPAREELHQGIWEAVDTLPPDYREALLLRFAEGYSADEAASFLGITPAAMRKRIERAQNMLKSMMWNQVEPALAKRKHKESLARGIMACVPLGKAPWLGVTGAASVSSASAVSKLALIGGIAVMSKKIAVGLGAVAVMLALALLVANRLGPRRVETPPIASVKTDEASQAAPIAAAGNPSTMEPVKQKPSPAPTSAIAAKSAEASEEQVKPASVSGLVSDSTANPIAEADVHLEIGRDRRCNDVVKTYNAKTGADGKYEITGIDTFGSAHVFASAEGYVMRRDSVDVSAGRRVKDVNLTLQTAAFFVEGKVVTSNRIPIPDATLDTLYYGYDEEGLAHTAATGQTTGNISGSKFLFAITDKNGAFKVAIPNEGLCDFRVAKEGYGPGFFPKIATGTTDALFVLRSGGAIAGKVTTKDGNPVEGTTVRVTGEVLPGGLTPSSVRIQAIPVAPAAVTTDARGDYLAEGLGEDYVYAVSVPMPESEGEKGIVADNVRGHIVAAMRELDEDMFGAQSSGARKTDVHVKAGQTTQGVDLVLGSTKGATIRGVVTDRTSGKPVCPVVVTAGSMDAADASDEGGRSRLWFETKSGGSAVTNLDGSYVLQIQDLTETRNFRISYAFMTEGGSAWEQPDEEVALLELGQGDEREVNFTVDAPVTVPVRYVGVDGAPLEGIEAAMRQAGGRGGCGGTLVSDADGRVTFHGVRPFLDLQALAWRSVGRDLQTIGVSDPFTGQPGETVPEVTVVCRLLGGVEGVLTYPDGRLVANTPVSCEGQRVDDTGPPLEGAVTTDANGAVAVPEVLPEGVYNLHVTFFDSQSRQAYKATAENVEIVAGATTNLGTLVAEPENDWMRVLQAGDYGRKSNEVIAQAYSKEWLDALPDPGSFLKTAFALYDVGRYQDALEVFQRMSETSGNDNMYEAISLVWQGQMLDLLGKREEAVAAYSSAADLNVTDQIRHDQFGLAYSPSEYARERMQEPFTRVDNQMK